jgi:hypothetical protein
MHDISWELLSLNFTHLLDDKQGQSRIRFYFIIIPLSISKFSYNNQRKVGEEISKEERKFGSKTIIPRKGSMG